MPMKANDLSELIESVRNNFKETLDISDYELGMISNSIKLIFTRAFTSSAVITEQIQIMLEALSNLNYLRSKLVSARYKVDTKHRVLYDKEFTVLTKMGRPSKQAIDSEIYYSNKEIFDLREKLEAYNNLLEYLDTQIKLLESTVRNYESQRYHQA